LQRVQELVTEGISVIVPLLASLSDMASESPVTAVNGPTQDHLELSFLMPRSIFTNVHIHLNFFATSTLVFLTTTATGESHAAAKPMGSLVYGMPNVCIIPSNHHQWKNTLANLESKRRNVTPHWA
jgi:hypothetical protein